MQMKYLDDSYCHEFETEVESVKDGTFVVLKETCFYPNGGGQPFDTGTLVRDDEEFPVVFVGKFEGNVSHEVSREGLREGDRVKGVLDWERRYTLMRYHTAAHVLSGVLFYEAGARITGNQLDMDKGRIDFDLENFDRERLVAYFQKANELIAKDLPLRISSMSRAEAEKDPSLFKLAKGLPDEWTTFRIVEIVGFDKQADGGTHVRRLGEVGHIEFVKAENKGKTNRRVYFRLSSR